MELMQPVKLDFLGSHHWNLPSASFSMAGITKKSHFAYIESGPATVGGSMRVGQGQKNVLKNKPSLTEVKSGSLEREDCQQTPLLKSVLDIENLIVGHRNFFLSNYLYLSHCSQFV
jgi:hypothetical protein